MKTIILTIAYADMYPLSMRDDIDELQERFWYRVEMLLARKGKNLQDMSADTGIKYPTILSWRTRKKLPDLASALAIARYLGVTVEYLAEIWHKATDLSRDLEEALADADPETVRNLEPKLPDIRQLLNRSAELMDAVRIIAGSHKEKE